MASDTASIAGSDEEDVTSVVCALCSNPFGVVQIRHRCRKCFKRVCGDCSRGRVRLEHGSDRVRVCDACATEVRVGRTEELEEAIGVRVQINDSLKDLLKQKYHEIEGYKEHLLKILADEEFLLEENMPFDREIGPARINFKELVKYLDERVLWLINREKELSDLLVNDLKSLKIRTHKLSLLKQRTQKSELDASRVDLLVKQRDRLRDTFKLQSSTIRSLQDRVEIMEQRPNQSQTTTHVDTFIGDILIDKLFPCLTATTHN